MLPAEEAGMNPLAVDLAANQVEADNLLAEEADTTRPAVGSEDN